MEAENTLARRIALVRASAELNQEEFGERIGIGRKNANFLENSKRVPSRAELILICYEFNINPDWLIYGKGSMRNKYGMFGESDRIEAGIRNITESGGEFAVKFIKKLESISKEQWDLLESLFGLVTK